MDSKTVCGCLILLFINHDFKIIVFLNIVADNIWNLFGFEKKKDFWRWQHNKLIYFFKCQCFYALRTYALTRIVNLILILIFMNFDSKTVCWCFNFSVIRLLFLKFFFKILPFLLCQTC